MAKPTKAMILAAKRELKRRAAKCALAPFVTYTFPKYQLGWVHEQICAALDKFLDDVINKKSPRLIITMPPRSGKSELVSRRFPAYALGKYPDLELVDASYSSELSTSFSKDIQGIMSEEEYAEVFPDTIIPQKGKPNEDGSVRQSDHFEIIGNKGSYTAVGVGGSLTGRGASILVIDDPVKDRAEADSETIRERVWGWYTSTAYTRLAPGGGVIVMMTRWHCDDLVGRLLAQDALDGNENWEVINFPAIAEHDEEHRKEGEALHPERYDTEALNRIRLSVGERDWNALYQQHPVPDGGAIFKADKFKYWTSESLPHRFDMVCISWDMTFKETSTSDFVVGQVWGRHGASFYLLDQIRGRMDFVKTQEAFETMVKRWRQANAYVVEDKANGPAIISTFKDKYPGVVPYTPEGSKQERAYAVTPFFEAGNVFFPDPDVYPWVRRELIPELLSFPSGAHDDQCDALTQGLSYLHQRTAWRILPANKAALRNRQW